MLTRVNPAREMNLDQWPEFCFRSTLKLGFKTIMIIIFILRCLSWTIIELRVFYKDILEIKNNKHSLWKYIFSISSILKV